MHYLYQARHGCDRDGIWASGNDSPPSVAGSDDESEEPGQDGRGDGYRAPTRFNTAGIVRSRIEKSDLRLQVFTYVASKPARLS